MSGRRSTLLSVLAAVLITALAIAAIFILNRSGGTAEIVLPAETPVIDAPPDTTPTGPDGDMLVVEVKPDTVQTVIATLERPDSYYRQLQVEKFWEDGSVRYLASVWVRTGAVRITINGTGIDTKNTMVTEDKVYIWYDGTELYEGQRDKSESLFHAADAFNMLLTYEDVLALPKEDIQSAQYDDYEGEYCIFVTAQRGDTGYVTDYVISVATGLLVHAQTRRDGEVVYDMTASEAVLSAPPEDAFQLPLVQ